MTACNIATYTTSAIRYREATVGISKAALAETKKDAEACGCKMVS